MAAYAAVVSLKKTIECILESSRISLVLPSPQVIQLGYKELKRLQEILERLDSTSRSKSRKKINALDWKIMDAVWKFEDLLESHLSDHILSLFDSLAVNQKASNSKSRGGQRDALLFSIDMECLRYNIDFFVKMVKELKMEYVYELNNLPEDEGEDEYIPSRIHFSEMKSKMKSKMVGLSDEFEHAKMYFTRDLKWNLSYALVGMAGVGKTTLAMKIFEDPSIVSYFECRAGVTVGRKSRYNEILQNILAQVEPNITCRMLTEGDDEKIGRKLKERLEGKRCLILLDDVWDTEVMDYLRNYLPDVNDGMVRVLLTTRLRIVAELMAPPHYRVLRVIKLLNEEESTYLLRLKVFGEDDFPYHLEKAGKKIAKNCEGLPLLIVTVADHLSNAEKTAKYWNEVAEKRNSVFTDAYNEIAKVLFPSYDYLPQYLKMFFLYMGAFPMDYEIPPSKLINMLTVEGFLEPYKAETIEGHVLGCLEELDLWNNFVISNKKSMSWNIKIAYPMKSCRLHSSWHHLCKREARKNKFLLVLNSLVDVLEGVHGHRRLCVHNSILFNIKEVCDSLNCDSLSTTRSLLFFGPYYQYPVPIYAGFKLLRILDAIKVRFYNFPIEILKLVQLQYLALSYNGKLPSSICKLFNLQFLIIHPHMSIKSCENQSYIPIQIWDMQELKHIEILGSNLPNLHCTPSSLKRLSTLLGVGAHSCTRAILSKIPNIKKLGIQIELEPCDDNSNPLSCFDHISELENLETLKCSVMNPEVKDEFVTPLKPLPMFPSRLRKLHLSGFGYPWKYMDVIGSLPNLEVLKLRCYAFQGPKWEIKRTKMKSFLSLKYLLIEDTDLVQWRPRRGSFPKLTYVSMRHCYQLEELHWPSDCFDGRIELIDCNHLAGTCAEQLKLKKEYACLHVITCSSLDDGELKS